MNIAEKNVNDDFNDLLDRLIDGVGTEQDAKQLSDILIDAPEMCRHYVTYLEMHARLDWANSFAKPLPIEGLQSSPVDDFSVDTKNGDHKASPSFLGFLSNTTFQVGTFFSKPTSLSVAMAFLVMVSILATLALVSTRNNPPDFAKENNEIPTLLTKIVATVTYVHECEWRDGNSPLKRGMVLREGSIIALKRGAIQIDFDSGVSVTLNGPMKFRLDSNKCGTLLSGMLTANVYEKKAIGFVINTPFAEVKDLGTRFSLWVKENSWTHVSVQHGKVVAKPLNIKKDQAPVELITGQHAFFSKWEKPAGVTAREIVHFKERFLSFYSNNVIKSVVANSDNEYRVVPNGLNEDVLAYSDRTHEWNGVKTTGIPLPLLGADYVITSRNDELNPNLKVTVTISRPAILYLFIDKRIPPPAWLVRDFTKTKMVIGLDRYKTDASRRGYGPGMKIDNVMHVWQRFVDKGELTLGYNATVGQYGVDAYGIAAVAITPKKYKKSETDK